MAANAEGSRPRERSNSGQPPPATNDTFIADAKGITKLFKRIAIKFAEATHDSSKQNVCSKIVFQNLLRPRTPCRNMMGLKLLGILLPKN